MIKITFSETGTFQATYTAEKWLRDRGFSVGSAQAGAPRAIWHGDCYISKWRGLSDHDKVGMDAVLTGEGREGPVTIELLAGACDAAKQAFSTAEVPA